jgi:hypothetical protein
LPSRPNGSGEKILFGPLTIEVFVDFVVGRDGWMLQGMDNMEVSCVFEVKVSMFTHLEQSKIGLLTVNESGIGTLTVQDDTIGSIIFM